MSTTIDQKVVEMRFDNKNFESNVATSMSTLDKLKQSLKFKGATKGIEEVSSAANRMSGPMSGIGSAVETVRAKFSALEVMGVTALANITNSAVNAGKRIVSALTIDPIKTGFQEYETQINAVQTILANTKSKGSTLKDVNAALDELNTYADKTIYNFTEMTRNIGTFTAAGVDLDTSVSAIKGIANLAAVSGSTSQQASTAMYQLSQALASGTVKLMDWNSVVNAGMGGQVFQDALKETARVHGVAIDKMIKDEGSFRETLKEGWLTSEILTETLAKFTGDLSEADLKKQGYTDKQIKEIMELGKTANDAATKVKTLTQLWDTLKEAAQSGWSQSWRIIVGDFEEAKELFTEISDLLGKLIGDSADSRNKVLQGWSDLGGRKVLIDSLRNAFEGIMSVMKPIKEAFREIFPPVTAQNLLNLTERLKAFTEKLKMSDETADKVKRTFKGIFSIFDIFRKVLVSLAKPINNLVGSKGISSLSDLLLNAAASIGDFFTSLNKNFNGEGITNLFGKIVSGISGTLTKITGGLSGFGELLTSIGGVISNVFGKIWDVVKKVFGWISDNVSFKDILAGVATGGLIKLVKNISGFLDKITGFFDNLFKKDGLFSIGNKVKDILDSVKNSLQAFTTGIKSASLLAIAIAVGILTASISKLAELRAPDIAKSIGAIGILMGLLSGTLRSMSKSLGKFGSKGIMRSGIALVFVAAAINILATAMEKISKLSLKEIGKGLAGIGGGLLELSIALKIIGKTKISLSTSIAILALAKACDVLGDALKKFGSMKWDEIGRGLAGMGGALLELTGAMAILSKAGGFKSLLGSVGILIAVQSLSKMADALKKFGAMSWGEIRRGLSAMGGALGELAIALGGMGKVAGLSSIFAASAIWITVQGLDDLADALTIFGEMSWSEIGRGLSAMGGALGEVAGFTGALGKIAGFSGILGAGAILITIQGLDDLASAFETFGYMSWSEIGRGLSAMGGALGEVAGITGALGKIAGFSGILGAGAILITIQGLNDLADAFKKFGEMSWSEIGRGLSAMGGALLEVGGISGALGYLTNVAGMLGSASIWIAIQGLNDLADAFKKFGEMSWSEIGRGLSAMGGALGELALGGLLNTLSIIGSFSISNIAEPLGVLADSVKKWENVTVPEGLGLQLSALASGILSFTFGGLGASAIATVAAPLGILSESVKKWTGVVIPEGLGTQLDSLASGISSFTFSGLGASAIASVATPLGALADSVKKWTGVTIPEGLEAGLTQIANGVKAFTWVFAGGWSINAIVEPLAALPDSVKKWNGVAIPSGLEESLISLANGIKAFTWAFMGGWSISAVIEPLNSLVDTVKKWAGVTVPAGLKDSLKAIADGIGEFTLIDVAKIQAVDDNLLTISNALKNLSSIKVNGTTLVTFAKNVKTCSTELADIDSSSIATAESTINTLVTTVKNVNSTSVSNVGKFVSAANSLNNIDISKINVNTGDLAASIKAIEGVMSSISKTISASKDSISKAMTVAMSGTSAAIKAKQSELTSAVGTLTNALSNTISKKKNTIAKAFSTLVSGAVSAIRDKYSSFKSAGSYLVSGFAAGISENSYRAAAKARAMAEAAEEAARKALAINSPSKVFRAIGMGVPEGFAQGIGMLGRAVADSSETMADTAINSTKRAITRLASVINSDIDTQPTIRPVIDLSNVKDGVGAINGMFNASPSMGLLSNVRSINTMMNRRNQNGVNDDVVSAINDLKKTIGDTSGDTYSFGDVIYDDGSNVSEAVRSLVRAIRVERRT